MEKTGKGAGWKKQVEIGGAFELVDSVNQYARRRGSLLPDMLV